MARPPTNTALLLIAHGSRHEVANDDTRRLAEELARYGPYPIVLPAFLEIAQPDIDAGAAGCVELSGATRVILLPHFLSAGIHVQRDLTAAQMRLTQKYPGVKFLLAQPLGIHTKLLDILIQRAREVDE